MKKLCLVASSGGHFEQIRMLNSLSKIYDIFYITERTSYSSPANYYLVQTGLNDKLWAFKMLINALLSLYVWIKERPDYVITTGTMIAIPIALYAKIFKKKLIYIESFAKVNDATRTGKFMYKYADLFIIQWKSLQKIYPDAVYGGCIY